MGMDIRLNNNICKETEPVVLLQQVSGAGWHDPCLCISGASSTAVKLFIFKVRNENMATESEVRNLLAKIQDPELDKSIVELGMVRDLQVDADKVSFTLALTSLSHPFKDRIVKDAKSAVQSVDGIREVDIFLAEMTPDEKAALQKENSLKGAAEKLNNVKHVIAVMSGKGGVGKSLVTGLLATSLNRLGHLVGVLDADITGPSIPKMFLPEKARLDFTPQAMLPARTHNGISVISVNLLLESEDQAVIWRGPLISNVIKQFWSDVLWGDLDYLLVDLPPGTSDASLTVLQSLPMSGVVLVTSPQNLAAMVVRKAAQMVRHVEIPILGLVENMSYFVCPDTGNHHRIFGPSDPEAMARQLHMPFLGCLPIDPEIAALCDQGKVEDYPGDLFDPLAQRIVELAPAASEPKMTK
jgi:ATP-binding protein involved in chromosome partitioning